MLIEFRVENYKSIRQENALTLEAAKVGDDNDTRLRMAAGHDKKLLPAAVIYGPNASGKSNVLSAIAFMGEAVLASHRTWDPEGGIPRTSFAWGTTRSECSTFEALFLAKGTRYQYGFSIDDSEVKEEWLYAWPQNHKQTWLEREGQHFSFGDKLKGPNAAIQEITRPNSLFLSAAVQNKHEQLSPLYSWFREIVILGSHKGPLVRGSTIETSLMRILMAHAQIADVFDEQKPEIQKKTIGLLKAADLGIVDIRRIKENQADRDSSFSRHYRIQIKHTENDSDSWLEFDEESEGTKTLFRMAPAIFRALEAGSLLVVDELESSLHPLIGAKIIELFNSPESNPHGAQLIFTTHDTNLLGNTLGEPLLRRDQIWFTEKNKEGATELYPLTNYKPRKEENLERGYLQGRYGAIPFLGDFSAIPG